MGWRYLPLLLLLSTVQLAARAQSSQSISSIPDSENWDCHFDKPDKLYLSSEEEVLIWIQTQFAHRPFPEFRLTHRLQSALGTHYTGVQTFEGKIIEGSVVRVHADHQNRIFLVQSTLVPDLPVLGRSKASTEMGEWRWIAMDGGLYLTERIVSPKECDYEYLFNGKPLLSLPGRLYFNGPDTTIYGRVFMVNPLNSANVTYGAPYADNDNSDHPVLEAELQWRTIPAQYTKDTFYLSTRRYTMAEISPPLTPTTKAVTDSFDFTRSSNGFEDVNAFYHINAFSDYLESLGFSAQLPDSLEIDAHAFHGDDRSAFTYNVRPHRLEFGTGGVDDAEDGEVVIHEFGHAISVASAPNTINGSDRKSMEEGNADYLCKSYSRVFETGKVNTSKVFSWDGHNEFWEGVKTDVKLTYPVFMTGNTRNDRALWSSPLLCMRDKIGKSAADSLVILHLLLQTSNALFPQMAMEILALDTLLFGGKHVNDIRQCFSENGIIEGPRPEPEPKPELRMVLFNSENFALGKGNLEVLIPGAGIKHVMVFNQLGQILLSHEGFLNKLLLKHTDYGKGTYFIHAETDEFTEVRRFVKLD